MKRIRAYFAAFLGALILSLGAFAYPSTPRNVKGVDEKADFENESGLVDGSSSEQSKEVAVTVQRQFMHYFDEGDALTTVAKEGETPTRDYWTPMSQNEVSSGANGGNNAGYLTLRCDDGLEDLGYCNPANSFDYSSYKLTGPNLTFDFAFHKVTSCSYMNGYTVANCATKSLKGYSLGQSIGTGTLIVLKRAKNGSAWTKISGAEYHNMADGAVCSYTPDPEDIYGGCYYRFLSAYQYYYYDHTATAFWITRLHYVFHVVLQEVTVYVARGGTTLKFASSATPSATHTLSKTYFEPSYGQTLGLNQASCRYGNPSIASAKDAISFSLTGEILPAGKTNSLLVPDVDLYFYNGVAGGVQLNLSYDRSKLSGVSFFKGGATTLSSTYVNPSTVTVDYKIANSSWEKLYLVQGLSKDEDGNPVWVDIDSSLSENLAIPALNFVNFELFRAALLLPIKSAPNFVLTAVSHFRIEVDTAKFRNTYQTDEGSQAFLSAAALSSTLDDGSIAFGSFSVSDNPAYSIEYAHNTSGYKAIGWDNVGGYKAKTFSAPGKYTFRVTNDFLETSYTNIYVVGLGDDDGRSTFFPYEGNLLDQNYRVYAPNSKVPCYRKDAGFKIKGDQFLPGLYGKIERINSDGSTDSMQDFLDLHSLINGRFREVGNYMVSLSLGDPNAYGDKITYTFYFSIVEDEDHVPTINYDLLHSGIFTNNLMPKVNIVSMQSKGEGSYLFVFPYGEKGYGDALDLAMEIESYDIVDNGDGTYSYPRENGNAYSSKFALFKDLKAKAKSRIHEDFLDADKFITDGAYQIDNVMEGSLDFDLYCVSKESVLEELVSDPVYLNGFSFAQVRSYESLYVEAVYGETGETFDIPYGVVVDDILPYSGEYLIHEYNHCGVRTYSGILLKEGDIFASMKVHVEKEEGHVTRIGLDKANIRNIETDRLYVKEALDIYDPYAIVSFEKEGEIHQYLLSEIVGKMVSGSGRYSIRIRNRLGYYHEHTLTLTGTGEFRVYEDNGDLLSYAKPEVIL